MNVNELSLIILTSLPYEAIHITNNIAPITKNTCRLSRAFDGGLRDIQLIFFVPVSMYFLFILVLMFCGETQKEMGHSESSHKEQPQTQTNKCRLAHVPHVQLHSLLGLRDGTCGDAEPQSPHWRQTGRAR
jgi:hypothetical protein